MNGEKEKEKFNFPETIITDRAAVIYNITPKYFAGTTFVANITLFGDQKDYTRQVRWNGRIFFGYRL